jgi:hypothetical protein
LLVIRDDQFAAIGQRAVKRRGDAVFARLCEEFPDFERRVFDFLFEYAIDLGYEDEDQVYRYCRLAMFLGKADMDHPLWEHVSPELCSPLMAAKARLAFTEREMMPRLLGDQWQPPPPPPKSPADQVAGSRVQYDVQRSTMVVKFPDSGR